MKLERYAANPVLLPDPASPWESGSTFNPGAALATDGRVYLLYRAIADGYTPFPDRPGYANYVSTVGCAVSEDGKHFVRQPLPVLTPSDGIDPYGCEDVRANPLTIDGKTTYLLTYTAMHRPAWTEDSGRIGLAQTDDFQTFQKHGIIGPDVSDKDAVIFPETINGKIVLLHRVETNIQLAVFDDLSQLINPAPGFWEDHLRNLDAHTILRPQFSWEGEKIGSGCPPIKTEEGWLIIYHGADDHHIYRAGLALLDLDDPSKVIARSPQPILEPEADYERVGDVPNVVFPQGLAVLDGIMHVYYGGADKVCALATGSVSDALEHLRHHRV
jgi:beta-1,2-mannobiose phosphorylase / 1,2-beta-oligomannan phosphorylase